MLVFSHWAVDKTINIGTHDTINAIIRFDSVNCKHQAPLHQQSAPRHHALRWVTPRALASTEKGLQVAEFVFLERFQHMQK
jgi:hypothetical protein